MVKKLSLFIVAFLMCALPVLPNTLTVTRVEAGDVIVLGDGWKTRVAGILVPGPKDPVGYRAFDFTKRHAEGAVVKVVTWTVDNTAAGIVRDEQGLPRATILFGLGWAHDLAERLLAEGLARVDLTMLPENCRHYLEIEAEAKGRGVGLWAFEASP